MRLQSYVDHLTERPQAIVLFAQSGADECFLRELQTAFVNQRAGLRLIIEIPYAEGQARVIRWTHQPEPVGGA